MATLRHIYILAALSFGLLAHGCSPPLTQPANQSPAIFFELEKELSPGAAVVTPGPEHQRWSAYASPTYSIVVEVAEEEDVQKTVRFANKHCYPFLAVTIAHGMVPSLAAMQGGIAISFIRMKEISVDDGGDFAHIGPGLTNGEVIRGLWDLGKETTTGICLCTGLTGIMLGGGHGYLQGQYGLVGDQILEARVVLADGSCVTASEDENKDLFWALRGAGHNFGIVTSLKFKVHERTEEWSVIQLYFSEDKLEEVFDLSNKYVDEADHPAELVLWQRFRRSPDLSDDTVIQMSILYQGELAELERYAAPFSAIGPLVEEKYDSVSYPDVYEIVGPTESSRGCSRGLYRHQSPTYLMRHNTTALRTVYNIFNDITEKYPDVGSTSAYLIEGYPIQGVTAVPSKTTATPFRKFPLLLSPSWGYADAAYTDDIRAATREMRSALVDGSGTEVLSAYVNYAFGDETLAEVYGHEPWKVRKLQRLKARYDPEGAFNFYMPIRG